jgi:hypothetical protein
MLWGVLPICCKCALTRLDEKKADIRRNDASDVCLLMEVAGANGHRALRFLTMCEIFQCNDSGIRLPPVAIG